MTAGVRNLIWYDAMNPFPLAVFVVGDAEVSPFSDEIAVNCVPLV